METCYCEKAFLKTGVGVIEILCCVKGVHNMHILPENIGFSEENPNRVMDSDSINVKNTMEKISDWLTLYFKGCPGDIEQLPPICPSVYKNKGDFTVKVWKILMTNVPFGQTISYGQLAALSGNGAASRAVGSAMKNNCIPLIIPCHRVIKSDGTIGQFSAPGGENVKRWLLNHENAYFKA